jgi:hypothetical protein
MRCWSRPGPGSARVRLIPARVTVYLLLAGCLFAGLGYVGVWQRLTAGLCGLAVATPTAAALRQLPPPSLPRSFADEEIPMQNQRYRPTSSAGCAPTLSDSLFWRPPLRRVGFVSGRVARFVDGRSS